jgi:hypothetical protein
MTSVDSTEITGDNFSATDLRQDLKDFKETKKSFEELRKVKANNLHAEVCEDDQFKVLKAVEDKARLALDKLFEENTD